MHSVDVTMQPFLERLLARSVLSEADQRAILGLSAEITKLGPGASFLPLGSMPHHACLLVDGVAARYGLARDGRRQITALYVRGDMPDLCSLALPPISSALETLTPCILLRVPHAALHKICQSPSIAEAFWRDTMVDTAICTEWVVNLGQRPAPARVAHIICELAMRYRIERERGEFEFAMPLTQHHLADAAGISAVHANRAVQVLKAQGLMVMSGRCIRVLNWKGLQQAADFDPSYLHLTAAPKGGPPPLH